MLEWQPGCAGNTQPWYADSNVKSYSVNQASTDLNMSSVVPAELSKHLNIDVSDTKLTEPTVLALADKLINSTMEDMYNSQDGEDVNNTIAWKGAETVANNLAALMQQQEDPAVRAQLKTIYTAYSHALNTSYVNRKLGGKSIGNVGGIKTAPATRNTPVETVEDDGSITYAY